MPSLATSAAADARSRQPPRPRRAPLLLVAGLAAVAAIAVVALCVGRYPIGVADVIASLLARLGGAEDPLGAQASRVLWSIRAPRVAAAIVVGAALASSGAAFQSVFRNPLVAPEILGVSGGAALGAALAIVMHASAAGVQAAAFAGGVAAVGLAALLARAVRRDDSAVTLVLCGVVAGSLATAGRSLVTAHADAYDAVPAITFWLLGSLSGATPRDLAIVVPAMLAGVALLAALRWQIDALTLDDDEARALGVHVTAVRAAVIAAATAMTAAAVAIAGIVGWIGLIVPHVARAMLGPSFGRLLPAAAITGAGFLCAVDAVARGATSIEIPVGVLTALLGAPLFAWVLARARWSWQ